MTSNLHTWIKVKMNWHWVEPACNNQKQMGILWKKFWRLNLHDWKMASVAKQKKFWWIFAFWTMVHFGSGKKFGLQLKWANLIAVESFLLNFRIKNHWSTLHFSCVFSLLIIEHRIIIFGHSHNHGPKTD